MKFLLQIFFEADDLILPECQAVLCLTVRQFHRKHILELSQILIHLLLSVAGRLPYD